MILESYSRIANKMMKLHSQNLKVKVWRGKESGSFKNYRVPARTQQTILDVVTYIQRNIDSTLSYRFSCRVGMCGTCAMSVNGVPRWTCRTKTSIFNQSQQLKIAPLKNFPIIKDLVVDMDVFFDKWKNATGAFEPKKPSTREFERVEPQSAPRIAADKAIECIGCGVCYAACDVVGWKPSYFGPAALNRGWSLVNDTRHASQNQLLHNLISNSGCLSCHTTQSCTKFCPKGLDPSGSIAGLKRKSLSLVI